MRYGCSVRSPEQAEFVIKYSYDYIEMNLCALANLSDNDFLTFQKRIERSPIKIEVFNLLLPLDGSIKIVGDEVDIRRQKEYLESSFKRAHLMGAELMVFGSGRARAVPEGYSPEKAYAQIVDFMKLMMGYADQYGIVMVIEPVCGKEVQANRIRKISDAIKLAEAVGHPNVFALCDLFHMVHENEPMTNIVEAGSWIRHAHISSVEADRKYPVLEDGYDYKPFFNALKAIGYQGRLSLECFDPNIDEGLVNSRKLLDAYK